MSRVLSSLVADAARRTPEAVAVVDGDLEVTYAQLDALAGSIAGALQLLGVGRGQRVGILLGKSVRAVASVHGVLRTGAAYVPLDVLAPPARLGSIVADGALTILVSDRAAAPRWGDLLAVAPSVRTIVLVGEDEPDAAGATAGSSVPDGVALVIAASAAPAPPAAVDPDDLAYVLYTSGTTGQPKGVQLTHANAWAFVSWAIDALEVTAGDRLSSHAPLHFDLSIFDLFAAAATGASVVLLPRAALVLPAEAVRCIEAHGITIWYSVPSALGLIAARGGLTPERAATLRAVVFAGEVMPPRTLAALMALVPSPQYWNWYGPTETNVCTAHRVRSVPADGDPPLPIGHPIDGVSIRILDDEGHDVPIGSPGELYVHGPTVTIGYFGDDELTAARLVDLGDRRRWYRTGDQVVQLPDGELSFRGRRDHQVKSRGHRIELGDVEAAVLRAPGVAEVAVVAVADERVTNLLHAFVTGSELGDGAGVLAHCRAHLPSAMVPATVTVLSALERTSTGKVDRLALARRVAT